MSVCVCVGLRLVMAVIRNGNDKISILIVNIINSFSSVSREQRQLTRKGSREQSKWRLVKNPVKHTLPGQSECVCECVCVC